MGKGLTKNNKDYMCLSLLRTDQPHSYMCLQSCTQIPCGMVVNIHLFYFGFSFLGVYVILNFRKQKDLL
jgi:hypothetical protein